MHNSILEAVYSHSLQTPDKLALADAATTLTYKELYDAAALTAARMQKLGLSRGDFVVIECTQNVYFVVMDLACELLGCVFVPIEKKADIARVTGIFNESGAKLILGQNDYSEIGPFVPYESVIASEEAMTPLAYTAPDRDALAEVLFSTGTTGQPKGIMISHRANVAIAENIACGTEMHAGSIEMIPLPLSHSHGLRTCYANFLNGSAVVVIDGVMNIGLFFKLMDLHKVNALDITPTIAKLLFKIAKKGLEKYRDVLEYIEIGTAVLENEVKDALKEMYPNTRLYNFYGSTEAGRTCVLDFNKEDAPSCIGYPSKNATFYITDENRNPIQSSAENPGLVAVSGSMMMDGYLGSEELTRATLVNGILYCSDLGYIDEKGRVYILGRADDIINYKGIKIAPEEIESFAIRYEGVTDCACVPIPDEICGQKPKLFISVSDAATFDAKEYTKFLKANLDIARVPAEIEIIAEIPRAFNGKLQRKKLREK